MPHRRHDRNRWSLKVLWEIWTIYNLAKWMRSLMRMRLVLWRMFLWIPRWSLSYRTLGWCYYPYSVLGMPSLIVSWLGKTWVYWIYFSKNTFSVEIFDNILEISTSVFYMKIMRFAGFLRVQIHSWNANISWTLAIHFIRSSLILSCSSGPFLFILCYLWLVIF